MDLEDVIRRGGCPGRGGSVGRLVCSSGGILYVAMSSGGCFFR